MPRLHRLDGFLLFKAQGTFFLLKELGLLCRLLLRIGLPLALDFGLGLVASAVLHQESDLCQALAGSATLVIAFNFNIYIYIILYISLNFVAFSWSSSFSVSKPSKEFASRRL